MPHLIALNSVVERVRMDESQSFNSAGQSA
jgi:hypothetical protein